MKTYKPTQEERDFVTSTLNNQQDAESGSRKEAELNWDDEYLIAKGDQWSTSIAPISRDDRTNRPNSVSNFILPTLMNIVDGLTTSTPAPNVTGREVSDDGKAAKLQDLITYIFYVNNFHDEFKKIVLQGIHYGCFIGCVYWDVNYKGGSGPSSYEGEIICKYQNKDEIYFDPAITNLEERMQECDYINRRYRKKLSYIKDNWDNGEFVVEDEDDDTTYGSSDKDEGPDPQQVTLLEAWHKGKPRIMPKKQKDILLAKAEEFKGKDSKAYQMYKDMADSKINGVHLAYVAGNVLLEYIPYVYIDGLYPFVFRTLYKDERNPWGYGEVRNIINPQVMYNVLMDIQLEAMSLQGLGGYLMEKGAMSDAQIMEYKAKMYKGAELIEVKSLDRMKKREPVQVPSSIPQTLDRLKDIIDTTSQNTAIAQGISPGANVPYSSIRDLGSRSDVRNKGKQEILKGFMIDFIRLIVNRISEFYTDEREYRIRGNKSQAIQKLVYDMVLETAKEPNNSKKISELLQLMETLQTMNPQTAAKYGKMKNTDIMSENVLSDGTKEMYVPDYDIDVTIADERPQTWQYYEKLAMAMYGKGLGPKSFWDIIIDGKLPSKEQILSELSQPEQQLDSKAVKEAEEAI